MPAEPLGPREPYFLYRPLGLWIETALIVYQNTTIAQILTASSVLLRRSRSTSDLICPRGYSPLSLLHAVVPRTVCQLDLYRLFESGSGPMFNCVLGSLGLLALILLRRARDAGVSVDPRLPNWLGFVPQTQVGEIARVRLQRMRGQAIHAPIMWWVEPAPYIRLVFCVAYTLATLWQTRLYPRRAAAVPQTQECEGHVLVEFHGGNTLCGGWGFIAFVLGIRLLEAAIACRLDTLGLRLLAVEKRADVDLWGEEV